VDNSQIFYTSLNTITLVLTSPHVTPGHYQLAILTLISGDLSQSPMGTDKESADDDAEVEAEGEKRRICSVIVLMHVLEGEGGESERVE
jgi:hypothetical protein